MSGFCFVTHIFACISFQSDVFDEYLMNIISYFFFTLFLSRIFLLVFIFKVLYLINICSYFFYAICISSYCSYFFLALLVLIFFLFVYVVVIFDTWYSYLTFSFFFLVLLVFVFFLLVVVIVGTTSTRILLWSWFSLFRV